MTENHIRKVRKIEERKVKNLLNKKEIMFRSRKVNLRGQLWKTKFFVVPTRTSFCLFYEVRYHQWRIINWRKGAANNAHSNKRFCNSVFCMEVSAVNPIKKSRKNLFFWPQMKQNSPKLKLVLTKYLFWISFHLLIPIYKKFTHSNIPYF